MRTECELTKISSHELVTIDYVDFSSDCATVTSEYLATSYKLTTRTY